MAEKENLTKARIQKAREDAVKTGKRVKIRDGVQRGLLAQVTPRGTATFYVRREIKGQDAWVKLGEFGDRPDQLTIEQARRKASEVLGDIVFKGYNPLEMKRAWREEPTLRDLFNFYIENHAQENRKTWEVMKKDFERDFGERAVERGLPKLADKKASQITASVVNQFRRKLTESFGPYTANRRMQLLRAVYNRAIKGKQYKGENPAAGITLHKEKERQRFLETNEIENFLKALEDEPHEWTRDIILLSIMTGVRKTNIYEMRYSDLDLANGTWTIPETKNGDPQTIALTGLEIKILKDRLDNNESGSDFVFPGTGKTGHITDIKNSWQSLRDRAKLTDVTQHDLRRSLGSWMASQNVNLALVKGALGHKDMKTTVRVYAKTQNDAQRVARLQGQHALFAAGGKAGKGLFTQVSRELNREKSQQPTRRRQAKRRSASK